MLYHSYSLSWFYLHLELTFASSLLKIYFVKYHNLVSGRLCLAAIVTATGITIVSITGKFKEIDAAVAVMAIVARMQDSLYYSSNPMRQTTIIFLFG
jgi:hypothetical protein